MRKSTVEFDFSGKSVEHVELWTEQESNDPSKAEGAKRARAGKGKDY
jgi:hypothetical protein